ncbi:MAG: adenylate/guanylate cyclase domain-containing protein [Pseudomonadota bacterium]
MSEAPQIQRKLTTILSADAANFSGRMAADEAGTVQALRAARRVIDAAIAARGGRIANTAGDGLIADFPSVVEAVAAAIAIQRDLRAGAHMPFRLGVHLGDVIVEGEDLLGDGVNRTARLQEIAPEGGIVVSRQVVDQAQGRLAAEFRPLAPAQFKHMTDEIAVFGIVADGVAEPGAISDLAPKAGPVRRSADAMARYRKTRNGMAAGIGGLILVDLMNGPGPSLYLMLPVVIMLGFLWRKRRAARAA